MSEMMTWIWIGIFVFCVILEFITEELVGIWFGIGALPALVLSFFEKIHWGWQIGVFFVVSALFLFLTRPLIMKKVKKNEYKTNIDAAIGETAKVLTAVSPTENGTVKYSNLVWTAISDEEIEVGTIVEITSVQGNKLLVRKK